MTSVLEKMKTISNELQDWIIDTLKQGVSPLAITNGLIKKGFDARFAYETMFEIAFASSEIKGASAYHYESVYLNEQPNSIVVDNQKVFVRSKFIKPAIVQLDDVLSDEECDFLIARAKSRLQPSKVIDANSGAEKAAAGRTSKGMYFNLQEDDFIARIEKRISLLTSYPIENGEGLQVLHYEVGDEYKSHFDFFPDNRVDLRNGGQRIATMLIYLNDVESGGETIFPKINASFTPKKGSAVFFHYGNSLGEVDRKSLHSSLPVQKGEKWVATKWIRQKAIY